MDEKNIKSELEWIYSKLHNTAGVYLLESIVDAGKEYCTDDVHGWAIMEGLGIGAIYGKIRDLVKVRILEAVSLDKLDKTLAGEILKTYYYAIDKERVIGGGGSGGRKEIVVRFV